MKKFCMSNSGTENHLHHHKKIKYISISYRPFYNFETYHFIQSVVQTTELVLCVVYGVHIVYQPIHSTAFSNCTTHMGIKGFFF